MKPVVLLTALFITVADIHTARADVIHYQVSVTFLDDTTFIGSFDYDATNQQTSNLRGILDDVLMGNVETLNYQLSAVSDGKGGITSKVYELNTTAISTNPPINNNVYAAINFNATDPALGATDPAQLAYMDCSAGGLMGQTCMYHLSWHNPVFPMEGGHGILSQTITASNQISRSDCFLNWAENYYAQLFAPAGAISQTSSPYLYRYYPNTNAYLGISSADSHVYYLGPDNQLLDVGHLSTWLTSAGC
ncbi:hypothetical protein [Methylobacter sp.]|uniref:hypothetical protein n=1 Tax=Methylobacter sp. TaxID=2051955 RepID=UPI002FDCDA9C